jgi:hypothetical protein
VICHNDVCVEIIVSRNAVTLTFVDFDSAAPAGALRPGIYGEECNLLDTTRERRGVWSGSLDPIRRLRLVADSYGLSPSRDQTVCLSSAQIVGLGRARG